MKQKNESVLQHTEPWPCSLRRTERSGNLAAPFLQAQCSPGVLPQELPGWRESPRRDWDVTLKLSLRTGPGTLGPSSAFPGQPSSSGCWLRTESVSSTTMPHCPPCGFMHSAGRGGMVCAPEGAHLWKGSCRQRPLPWTQSTAHDGTSLPQQ